MEMRSQAVRAAMYGKWARLCRAGPAETSPGDELPLRSELFSADQMEQHGKILAGVHQLTPGHPQERLLARLAENETLLLEVHKLLTEDVKADRRITPGGEWLLDNFYVIEEQIRTASRHLPKGYSRELPRLSNGPSAGLPRVYDIALETISHGDGRVDPENLSRFVAAYQSVATLKLGELWAIPIMLRLALIENLRRVAVRIAADRDDRNCAARWAAQMTETAVSNPTGLILTIADMARSNPPLVSSFVAELARRLQGQGPALALPLTWIEQRLAESGQAIEQLVRAENQQQAADQVSMSNSIGSLRFLSAMDWRKFVETMSIVEQILTEDPVDAYGRMDFATRDHYRHVVERTAKNSRRSESDVARQAIQLAQEEVTDHGGDERTSHVGYYLIDEGLEKLEHRTKARLSPTEWLRRVGCRFPLLFYGGNILVVTVVLAGGLTAKAYADGLRGTALGLVGILSLFCASHLAVALVNWVATLLTAPRRLPRLDFSRGIPRERRTLVVIPAMLNSDQGIEELIETLEVRFLANRDDHLHFGLLTDYLDASEESLPQDELLLQLVKLRIEELNRKYRRPDGQTFFLFHRPRRWNPWDRTWMGRERKRGKLADLNALLRGDAGDLFALVVGEIAGLRDVKYVITLDTDTQLARDSARQFVGAMAHPLNRARYDEDRQRVVAGYGILQPRVAASLSGTNRSRYARMCASELGIDPYTRAASDVYQDLFGEGSFIGKGIYEVDTFEQALGGRLPDNRILSHDLLEGCFARSGLLSDVQLYEDYPARYSADVTRRRRWIRGDWQIARWLMPGVPGADGRLRKNPLSLLSRWKIFDNLRRSLMAAALTLLLLLGWTVLPSSWFWTLAVLGLVLAPSLLASVLNLLQKPVDVTLGQHVVASGRAAGRHFAQATFSLICLPYEAYFSLDAMLRTLWRLVITRKKLLQWNPSGDADRHRRTDLFGSFQTMWIGPAIAVVAAIALTASRPIVVGVAAPILGLWCVSPVVAWWLSRPRVRHREKLTAPQIGFLRRLSRRTWAFFETFVGPDDHWLPPDNYQEHPVAVLAHRTSPTNMGLALLANLAAYDFGFLSAGRLVERSALTLRTMEGLERHRGHFYNWYDTQSLRPLPPLYISSVDSGNLGGHLLTLRLGLLGLADRRIVGPRLFEGLRDTLEVLADTVAEAAITDNPEPLAEIQHELGSATRNSPANLMETRLCLDHLAISIAAVVANVERLDADPESPSRWWARALDRRIGDSLAELDLLAPWTCPEAAPAAFDGFAALDGVPTLRELATLETGLSPAIERRLCTVVTSAERTWLGALLSQVAVAGRQARARIAEIETAGSAMRRARPHGI